MCGGMPLLRDQPADVLQVAAPNLLIGRFRTFMMQRAHPRRLHPRQRFRYRWPWVEPASAGTTHLSHEVFQSMTPWSPSSGSRGPLTTLITSPMG